MERNLAASIRAFAIESNCERYAFKSSCCLYAEGRPCSCREYIEKKDNPQSSGSANKPQGKDITSQCDVSTFEPTVPLLHIIAQESWHQPAFVVGNRIGLINLRNAINRALEGNGVERAGVTCSDGEGYILHVRQMAENEMAAMPRGYTASYAPCDTVKYPGWMLEPSSKPSTWLAEQIAEKVHKGQVDKLGRPYIEHLRATVVNLTTLFPDATQDEIDAAWLHDVLEDSIDAHEAELMLKAEGIRPEVIDIVKLVTRPPIEYLSWIEGLAAVGNISALKVKLADNMHNRDPERVMAIADGTSLVAKRYEPARLIMENALRRLGVQIHPISTTQGRGGV